jgi:predicted transposase YbfD/YdcC
VAAEPVGVEQWRSRSIAQQLFADRFQADGIARELEREGFVIAEISHDQLRDALHCNRPFAAAVLKRGANYALALKQNQGKLFAAVVRRFARAGKRSTAGRREPSTHDRREARRATVIRDTSVAAANRFPGVAALARVTSRRRLHGRRADKPVVRYYLLSKYTPAKRLLQIVRSHWGIENQLHWVLDVVFDEDGGRTRKDNGPENLAILRRFALNIIRSHPDRISMRQKVKRAGWDDTFVLDLLSHMR